MFYFNPIIMIFYLFCCFFLQENASMSRFLRAAPDMMNGMTTPLLPQTVVAIGPLATQERGMSLPRPVT